MILTHKDIAKNIFFIHDRGSFKVDKDIQLFLTRMITENEISDEDFKKLSYMQLQASIQYQSVNYPKYTE